MGMGNLKKLKEGERKNHQADEARVILLKLRQNNFENNKPIFPHDPLASTN